MNPVRDLAELLEGIDQAFTNARQLPVEILELARRHRCSALQLETKIDEPLLRPVVQIAPDPPSSLVCGCNDPRPRGLHLTEAKAV